jgi:hypothetical protein
VWVRLDGRFFANPKILGLSDAALAFYARALSYCGHYETDGILAPSAMRELCRDSRKRGRIAGELLDSGLLDRAQNGALAVHDWHDYNPSRAESAERRELARERLRRFRSSRESTNGNAFPKRVAKRVTNAGRNASTVNEEISNYTGPKTGNALRRTENAPPPGDPPRPQVPVFQERLEDLEPSEEQRNFGRDHAHAMLKRLRGLDPEPDDPEVF